MRYSFLTFALFLTTLLIGPSSVLGAECTRSATTLSVLPCTVGVVDYDSEIIASQSGGAYDYEVFWNSETATFSYTSGGDGRLFLPSSAYIGQSNWSVTTPYNSLLSGGTTTVITLSSPYTEIAKYDVGTSAVDSRTYITSSEMCSGDTREGPTIVCSTSLTPLPEFSGTFNFETEEPLKLDFQIRDSTGDLLDSYQQVYTESGYYLWDWTTVAVGTSTESVFTMQVCAVPPDAISTWGNHTCLTQIWGNGTSTEGYMQWAGLLGPESKETLYDSLHCSDVSLLSFASSTYCALLWAFEPSPLSVNSFQAVSQKLLTIYPLGYATLLYRELASSTSATSSAIFDRDINFGKWFGVDGKASTTISSTALVSKVPMVDKILDFLKVLVWSAFAIWLLIFGFTRTL
jgi:hypothetical protein